jgi:hypothetical protein
MQSCSPLDLHSLEAKANGISGHIEVYQYNETNKWWTQYGQDLSVLMNDNSGEMLETPPNADFVCLFKL